MFSEDGLPDSVAECAIAKTLRLSDTELVSVLNQEEGAISKVRAIGYVCGEAYAADHPSS
jgi:hypothetical protein